MSALGNALLRAAKAEPVPNGAEGRALAKLGVIGPSATIEPSLVGREATRAGISLAPIAASIAGSAIVAAFLFANYTHSASPPPRQPVTVERVEPLSPNAYSVVAPEIAVTAGVDTSVSAPASDPSPIAPQARATRVAQAAPAPSAPATASTKGSEARVDSLDLELALVREAKKRLEAGDPSEAIAALDRYAARFADGALAQEAAAVRVEALFALGDRATAIRAARLFFERHPASPYGHRIEALLRANR